MKKRKILSCILVFALIFTLSGCGNSKTTQKDFLDVANEQKQIKSGTFTEDITVKIDDKDQKVSTFLGSDSIKLSLIGSRLSIGDKLNFAVNAKVILGDQTYDAIDLIIMNDVTYLNISKLIDALFPVFSSQMRGEIPEAINPETIKAMVGVDYISFNETDIKNLIEKYGSDIPLIEGNQSVVDNEIGKTCIYLDIAINVFSEKMNEIIRGNQPAIIGEDGDYVTFFLNKDNIETIAKKIAESLKKDGTELIEKFFSEIKSKLGEEDELYKSYSDIKGNNSEGMKSQIDEMASKIEEYNYKNISLMEPKIFVKSKVSGDDGKRISDTELEVSIKNIGSLNSADFFMKQNIKEDNSVSITAPDKSQSLAELLERFPSLQEKEDETVKEETAEEISEETSEEKIVEQESTNSNIEETTGTIIQDIEGPESDGGEDADIDPNSTEDESQIAKIEELMKYIDSLDKSTKDKVNAILSQQDLEEYVGQDILPEDFISMLLSSKKNNN